MGIYDLVIGMLWQTHIRIINEVLRRLSITQSNIEANRLREGLIAPDKWGDYPHHYGKSHAIQKYVSDARKFFLDGDLPNACFSLGVSLHYIQDSYTSLSSRSVHHGMWEQQIEESYFVDDLERTIRWVFREQGSMQEYYLELLRILSREIEGKEETLRVATLLGHEPPSMWAKPLVDLNLAFRASLLVTKSVFSPKTCPELETSLRKRLTEYEAHLKSAEIAFADKIIELVKKRDELKKRKKPSGIVSKIRNLFLDLAIGIRDFQACSKTQEYEEQKHLQRVAKNYEKTASNLTAPHLDWYDFKIPKINMSAVEKELLSIQEAATCFEIDESVVRMAVAKKETPCYYVRDKELIRKSELRKQMSCQSNI